MDNGRDAFHSDNMSDLRARFAAEIRAARQAAGMTQERLAEAAETSVDFLSKIERGLNSPSLETLAGLVSALSLDPVKLLSGDDLRQTISASRRKGEARLSQIVHTLDDRTLNALVTIAEELERLSSETTKTPKAARRRRE